jgi:TatD DNase family protein
MKIFDPDIVTLLPSFTTALIETHCHLDYLNDHDLDRALDLACSVGIDRVITIAVSPENLDTVLEIANSRDQVWATQGVHPHESNAYSDSVHSKIEEQCKHSKVVAIGEIGLDYYYDHSDRQAQITAFERQLDIATSRGLPVVIHSRDADEDMLAILRERAPNLSQKGVIHSFTSGQALAEAALELGFYLGFNGITTFKNAHNVRAIVELTPIERIVLETDSPYLTPVPYRGKPNAPHLLGLIATQIAQLKELPVETCLQTVRANSLRLFWNQ